MRASTLCVLACVAFVAGGDASGKSVTPEIFPLSKVKRGQKGYGLTTIQGTTPERFEFEVIGVNHNFLPKMDIILVKSDDPKLQITGFWQGMSGSPLFIDDKLVCAFSYGFRFNKVPIGGCTPIHYMQEEGFRARRHFATAKPQPGGVPFRKKGPQTRKRIAPRSASSMRDWEKLIPGGDIGLAMTQRTNKPWFMNTPLPTAPRTADTERGMKPAALPLAMSGFSASAFDQVKDLLSDYPLQPMMAGGTGSPTRGPKVFQPGGAIAVQLIRGDMSAASTGTVSLVDGSGVLAFGHPMFHAGEIYAPVAAAEIHTVIPSAMSAFIVASPLRELGALVQDRQSTIAADTSLEVGMIPLRIRVATKGASTNNTAKPGLFNVEVLDNKFFTPTFAAIATMNAMSLYLPDRDDVTLKIRSRVHIKNHQPLRFIDHVFSSGGARGAVGAARGLRALLPLLNNPYSPVVIEGIDIDIQAAYKTNFGDIVGVRLPTTELVPGTRTHLTVELRQYSGPNVFERVPFDVPASFAGSIVKLQVSSGDMAYPDVAPPQSLPELIEALRKLLPGTVYAVTLHTADEGAAIDGKLVRDLPASALDRLRTVSSTKKSTVYRPIARSTYPAKRVINGSASMLIKVADRDTP